jgi:GNAT superfamily N-acetyltransferase
VPAVVAIADATVDDATTGVRVRDLCERDWEDIAELAGRIDADRVSVVRHQRHFDAQLLAQGAFVVRLVAEDRTGRVLGFGRASPWRPWVADERVHAFDVAVDPDYHGRGIGSALYERLLAAARVSGAAALRTSIKETSSAAAAFCAHRGFGVLEHMWEMRLDVRSFGFPHFAGVPERAAVHGIAITTLAELRVQDRHALEKLHAMWERCRRDEPSLDPHVPWPYEDFMRLLIETPVCLPDAWFIATRDGSVVGASQLRRDAALPDVLQQGFTCVAPEYRGRGVAMALKLQTVQYAHSHGYREIRTRNSTRNRPMLAINEAMGFQKQPAWILVEKQLHLTGATVA